MFSYIKGAGTINRNILKRKSDYRWEIQRCGSMNVEGVIFASETLINEMDDMVARQVQNVASLPGIVRGSFAMPDAHWGYGFCIGGVAAFDPDKGGVVSAGGVGFDIACGVRTLHTGLRAEDIKKKHEKLADALFSVIPAGVGSTGTIKLTPARLDEVLLGGAKWAVENGYGTRQDLEYIESKGCISGADPSKVSQHAKERQLSQMGTLGSGNHYLEVQQVVEIYDEDTAKAFGIEKDDIKISIHCGSRGLGHQIGTDYLKQMTIAARQHGLNLPERELACAPLSSDVGKSYLGAMRCGINCALANRQILMHLTRKALEKFDSSASVGLLYDVSHNTCQVEEHKIDKKMKKLFVHRKGATRAWGPNTTGLPAKYMKFGQPVLIGGTMGTASYILAGTEQSGHLAFGSSCHGAGRTMSRKAATKRWRGRDVANHLARQGVIIRSKSMRGVAEEAPGAYKDVSEVIEASHNAGLATKVAKLVPLACIKG